MAPRNEHAPRAPAAPCLADMPPEVIERILVGVPELRTLMAANATSRLFRGTPGSRLPVEHALRERARARRHERALPTALPPDVCSWSEELFARECALQLARTHRHVVACARADNEGSLVLSAFVDAEGGLHTCGEEEVWDAGAADVLETNYVRPSALGIHHLLDVLVPTRVASLRAVRLVSVAAGAAHLLALSEAGTMYGCGENGRGQLGMGDEEWRLTFSKVGIPTCEYVSVISAGSAHSLALTATGCAYSWGFNGYGQLGHGDYKDRCQPMRIEALRGVRVGGLCAGSRHTLLLSLRGDVYSCGCNMAAQLGHRERDQHTPRRIEALAGVRAVHVSAGDYHSLVVDAEGGAYAFGSGSGGQLGNPSVPTRIKALAGVRAVRACAGCCGSAVMCADGSVYTFGDNRHGQLCAPASDGRHILPARVQAPELARVLDCALCKTHALYVTADGAVHSCGEQSAALGLGVSADHGVSVEDGADGVHSLTRIEQLPRLGC